MPAAPSPPLRLAALTASILDAADCFVFDCDGVIWKGDSLVDPRVPAVLEQLRTWGKKVLFVTNASGRSREQLLGKFRKLGMDTVQLGDIYNSGFAAAEYITLRCPDVHAGPQGKKVYIIGLQGVSGVD